MSEFKVDTRVAMGFMLAGTLALAGCSGESSDNSPATTAPVITENIPDTEILTDQVVEGPAGALRDQGYDIATKISDVNEVSYDYDPANVDKAYADAATIPNIIVQTYTTDFINWRLAANTRYVDSSIYTYDQSQYIMDSNKESVSAIESLVDKIASPDVKAVADKNLDYVEAQSAVEAATGPTLAPEVSSYLLSVVEDQSVLELARSAVGGNQADQDTLEQQAREADNAVQDGNNTAFSNLYNGSNSQAKSINDQIAAFNDARAKTGN